MGGGRLRSALAAICIGGAPWLLVAGWVFLIRGEGKGPSAEWAAGHLLLLAGVALLAPAALAIRSLLLGQQSATWRDLGAATVLLGVLATTGQLAIDLAAWRVASNRQDMSDFLRRMAESPVLAIPFYIVPTFLFLGLLIQSVGLARRSRAPAWSAGLAVGGLLTLGAARLAGTGSTPILLGYVLLAAGFTVVGATVFKGEPTEF
jgi:hypothetical protein